MSHKTAHVGRARARVAAATALAVIGTALALASPASAAVGAPGTLTVSLANSSTPVLSWTRPKGVTDFSIQIDNDPSFSSTEVSENTKNTRYVPTKNLSRGTQYWRVRATKNGQSSSWATGSFNVSPVSVPVGTYPPDGAVLPQPDSPPLLRWQTSRGATSYTVEVDGDADFIGAKSWTTKTTSLAVPDALPAGDYFWRVTGSLEGGYNSTPSPTMSFILGALPSPKLTYPVDDINQAVEDVVFDWEPVPGAVTYDLQVATDSTFNNFAYKAENLYGSRYSPPTTLYNDQFWWRVRAVDLAGQPTAWSTARFSFKRQWLDTPAAVSPTGATNVADADVALSNGDRVFYQWTPVQHASRYLFQVSLDANFSSGVKSCTTSMTTFAPRSAGDCSYSPGTVHYWRARPEDTPYQPYAVPGIFSAPQKVKFAPPTIDNTWSGEFQTVSGLKAAMTGTGAANSATGCSAVACAGMSATPVLTWNRMPGITSYTVLIAVDENFTFTPMPSINRYTTTNNFFTIVDTDDKKALPESEAGQPYFWYVLPCRNGLCGPSPISQDPPLPGAHTFQKISPAVSVLTSSDPGGSDITFSWQDYFDTNSGAAGAAYGETGQQSARTYRIQVDNEPSFAEPLLDTAVVDQATYTAGDRLYPEGRIYWRVQALDDQENGLTWSTTAELVKASPALSLRSPVGNAVVAGAAPLEWSPQAFARSYDVEVYKNNDVAFSPANRVLNARVANPAFTPSEPLPASPVPYVWRVRRNDSKGNPGPWSGGSFVSRGSAPELLTPASGVWQRFNGPYFEWSDVAGASTYQVSLRNGTNNATTTTVATAFAPSELSSGDYTWTVTAFDAAGKALGTSAARTFRVDAIAPTLSTMKPQGSATPKSIFVATFSEKVKGVSKKTMRLYQKGKKKPLKAKVVVKGRKAKLKPATKLKKGKTYLVKLTHTSIKDVGGNSLVKPNKWSVTIN